MHNHNHDATDTNFNVNGDFTGGVRIDLSVDVAGMELMHLPSEERVSIWVPFEALEWFVAQKHWQENLERAENADAVEVMKKAFGGYQDADYNHPKPTELPTGYRWANEYECEAASKSGDFSGMIQIRRGGTDDEPMTDLAVPMSLPEGGDVILPNDPLEAFVLWIRELSDDPEKRRSVSFGDISAKAEQAIKEVYGDDA